MDKLANLNEFFVEKDAQLHRFIVMLETNSKSSKQTVVKMDKQTSMWFLSIIRLENIFQPSQRLSLQFDL